MPTTKGKPAPRPYTEEDRRALFAPIAIRSFGGKSWGGSAPNDPNLSTKNHRYKGETDRYAHTADRWDVDHL